MLTRDRQPAAPLFDLYGLDELARLTGYSEVYLIALKQQPERIRPRFRLTVSRILGRSEAELFDGVMGAGPPEYTATGEG